MTVLAIIVTLAVMAFIAWCFGSTWLVERKQRRELASWRREREELLGRRIRPPVYAGTSFRQVVTKPERVASRPATTASTSTDSSVYVPPTVLPLPDYSSPPDVPHSHSSASGGQSGGGGAGGSYDSSSSYSDSSSSSCGGGGGSSCGGGGGGD
jgi:hypothetical protein